MAQRDIKYINRDFSSFKEALIEYAKNYFPEVYNDFTEATPGNMFIEMASYVGDVLSFYVDKQTQENLLLYAQDKQNLIAMAYTLGYRPKVVSTAIAELSVYQQIPAKITSNVANPDYSYCLIVDKEAKIKSSTNSDTVFVTQDLVDFSFSSSADPTEVSVYQINNTTNQPEYYLLKKKIKAIAGTIKSQDITFGQAVKFDTAVLPDTNIIQILDVIDSDGNKWYEVPYLAQNTVFNDVLNNASNDPTLSQYNNSAPYLLKLITVNRRFVSRYNEKNELVLEFGSGIVSADDSTIIPNPDNVGIGNPSSVNKMFTAYDPSNFIYTKEYGLAPSNTTLTVRYIIGGGAQTNVPANDLSQIYELTTTPVSLSPTSLNQGLLSYIQRTVSFNNELPSSGGGDGDTVEDIRQKTIASFPTQLRNVTKEDHIIRALSLPPKYGSIAKAYITQDLSLNEIDSATDFIEDNPLALSLYVLSYDANKRLTEASPAVKENLKTYVSQYKILTDAINIKNAYYINIGINFDIIVLPAYNSREVLNDCLNSLRSYFDIDKWQINQPIILSELYNVLSCGNIKGVQSVVKIEVVNKYGVSDGYSQYGYDIKGAIKNNIIYPSLDPSIFEVRYPNSDIYGRVLTY
jgi:hypothetical protein